ncbi:MAG: type IV secretory system conjugative DNA transfer family protein, partial [Faecalimonas sp.]|nr:type IV secretory system conjugative DNA transfer family protein [Faecalimonas sp.]
MKTKIKHDYKTILSCNHTISLNTWESGINNNIIIVGSPGSGKTRKFIKPNILQKNTSYIITDVKGNLITECGEILTNKQDENDCEYTIKVLNLIDPSKSMHYNPFA